jgi:thioesterase domain-containing protein
MLAEHFGPTQPIYGFNPLGLDGKQSPHETVEAMATAYITEMRQRQPSGPYIIGGMCFGCFVALEMAQQLQQMGQTVRLLILFDPDLPTEGPSWSLKEERKMQIPKPIEKNYLNNILVIHYQARLEYQASHYSGDTIFFASRDMNMQRELWRELLIGNTKWVLTQATHAGFLRDRENLRVIVGQLRRCIDDPTNLKKRVATFIGTMTAAKNHPPTEPELFWNNS